MSHWFVALMLQEDMTFLIPIYYIFYLKFI